MNTNNYQNDWDRNYYQTGSTQPPKNRSGCIIALLALVIILGSVVSLLGILNIRLFRQVNSTLPEAEPAVGFTQEMETTQPGVETSQEAIALEDTPKAVENIPQEGGLSLQQIYEKAIPSVASIATDVGTGTGIVLSSDGYVVTNYHVIAGASRVEVLLSDDRMLEAKVVGSDEVTDLAVLSVEATDLTPAAFGNSDSLRVGDMVVAIGDPLGIALRGTMTDGIVSAINRDLTTGGRTMTLIQTNAALNSGNSGGPLLNCYGQVVGINTIKIGDYMNDDGVEGLGFAIPSITVKEVVDQLISQGYVSGRPDLGISGQTLSTFDRLYYRLPQGIYITAVTGDAAQKGIRQGDVLLQVGDSRITDADDLKTVLYNYKAGDTVDLIIYRNGMQYTIQVVLSQAGSQP